MNEYQRNILPACLALILGVAAAPAQAQPKPAEVRTIGPAISLSDEQVKAIAAKGTPAPLRVEPVLRPLKIWQPRPGTGATAVLQAVAITPAASAGATGLVHPASALPPGKMPPRAPKPYRPAPGRLDPFSLKPDEIAVVGGQKIHIPRAAGFPAAARKTP